jgi:hypothetical protein
MFFKDGMGGDHQLATARLTDDFPQKVLERQLGRQLGSSYHRKQTILSIAMKLRNAIVWASLLALMSCCPEPATKRQESNNEICRGALLQQLVQVVYEFQAKHGELPTELEFRTVAKELMNNYVDSLSFVSDAENRYWKNRYQIQEQRLPTPSLVEPGEPLLRLDSFRGLFRHEPGEAEPPGDACPR